MKKHDFNTGWTYRRLNEPAPGKQVTIPHDAMISEKRTINSAGGINTGWFEGYDYIYEKEFYVPEEYRTQQVLFEFEGVYRNAEVYLNGVKAGYRPYGYTNFYVDASEYLRYGVKNTIEVIARNADQPNSRWYSGAGIYRPVWMYTASKEHIKRNGIKIRTVDGEQGIIEAWIQTTAPGKLTLEIYEEQICGRAGAAEPILTDTLDTRGDKLINLQIPDRKLWDTDHPNLYRMKVIFRPEGENTVADTEEVVFGIRTIGWDTEKGFSVNGKRVILRGACIHHDNGVLGACCYPDAEERKIRLLRENGYNAVRSAHNPCSKALLDACDRLGMMVMDEFVDVWYIHKTEYDYVNYFKDWWRQDLKDMVDKDYNHPSVIMYSTGNEVSETAQRRGIKLTKTMTEYLHRLDASRPVTCGINIFFNFLSSIGFGVYSDKKAKKEAEAGNPQKQGRRKKTKAVGSQFFNDLAGLMGSGFMKTGATFYGCDVKTRDAFAAMDIAGYNYGIKRYIHDLKKYPDRLILGSETFCSDAYAFWETAKRHPRIIGDFVWAGMDYLGEVGVGAWVYKDHAPDFSHGPGWITAGSGRIDLTGKPLAEAGYTKTAFELTDRPVIAVRPVNHTDEKHSPSAWKMTDAIESWSWSGCEGKKAYVEVYARAAKVALILNGKAIGEKELRNRCDVRFEVKYEPGTLEAVAYDSHGKEISRNALRTAGEETILTLAPEESTTREGGLCYIRMKYTDNEGMLKPLERGLLRVQTEHGKLLGIGNGCPYNRFSYTGSKTETYFGEALAVVQADGSGPVRVAVSDGIRRNSAEITI